MGWSFDTHLARSTKRTTLAAAVIVMAAVVMLLWLGSLRSVDTVSADGNRSVTDCPQAMLEECDEVISQLRPFVEPNHGSAGYAYGEQLGVRSGFLGITDIPIFTNTSNLFGEEEPALGSEAHSVGMEGAPKCHLPGIPCIHIHAPGYHGHSASDPVSGGLRDY